MTKFHCRRHVGMNFGNVTENEVNSNGFASGAAELSPFLLFFC